MISFNGLLSNYTRYSNNVMEGANSMVSHKEAERRRRQRINSHLSTLRTLLPATARTSDKATLLAEVVEHVKELKRRADDVSEREDLIPGEVNEASLMMSCEEGEGRVMKATLCCEDRPGLYRDLAIAIGSVRVGAVKVEMVTVGGRMKSVMVMKWDDGGDCDGEVVALTAALTAVVENRVSNCRAGSVGKRARLYGSGYGL